MLPVPTAHKSLRLYSLMHRHSPPRDSYFILFTLKSCSRLRSLPLIRHLHAHILKSGFMGHPQVGDSLFGAYVLTSFVDACALFDKLPRRNEATWNTMVTGYVKSGDFRRARMVFEEMPRRDRWSWSERDTATWNTMITGYAKSRDLRRARMVFEEMPVRDVTSWSAMSRAYLVNGNWELGLEFFRGMTANANLKPDEVVLGSVLSCCARMGATGLLIGKSVHGFVVKNGGDLSEDLGQVLIDMYMKCGLLKNACQVFDLMQERNVKSWTALICGSAQHGYGKEARTMFGMMQDTGVKPNEITLTGVLRACVLEGLVEEGRKYFKMIEEYGLEPRIQHFGCMVDLFGRAGMLEEAYEMIKTMKFQPNVFIWGSFLSACKEHTQFDMFERVVERIMNTIKPENDGGVYTHICDLYVLSEKWDDFERVRKLMVKRTH